MDEKDRFAGRDYDDELELIRKIASRNNALHDSLIEYLKKQSSIEPINLIFNTSSTSRNTDAE